MAMASPRSSSKLGSKGRSDRFTFRDLVSRLELEHERVLAEVQTLRKISVHSGADYWRSPSEHTHDSGGGHRNRFENLGNRLDTACKATNSYHTTDVFLDDCSSVASSLTFDERIQDAYEYTVIWEHRTPRDLKVARVWWDMAAQLMEKRRTYQTREFWGVNPGTVSHKSSEWAEVINNGALGDHDVFSRVWRNSPDPKSWLLNVGVQSSASAPTTKHSSVSDRKWQSYLMIHPDSIKRLAWVVLGLVFMAVDVLYLTLAAYGVETPAGLEIANSIYWSLDIPTNFFIGLQIADKVDTRFKVVATNYMRTWFSFDLFIVAFQWLAFSLRSSELPEQLWFFRYLRALRHIKLLRLAKFSRSLRQLVMQFRYEWTHLLVKMIICVVFMLLWVHLSASVWYWIGSSHENGWVSEFIEHDVWPENYILSLHWACSQIQGGIDIYPITTSERLAAVLHLLASVVGVALVISRLTNVMSAMQRAQDDKEYLVRTGDRYVEYHNLQRDLGIRLHRYLVKWQVVQQSQMQMKDEAALLAQLPIRMKRELQEEARWPRLRHLLLFRALRVANERVMLRLLCDVIIPTSHMPDDLIFHYGLPATSMFVTMSGESHYLPYTEVFFDMLHRGTQRRPMRPSLSRTLSRARSSLSSDETMVEEVSLHQRHRELNGKTLTVGTALGEAVLWTRWSHCGDFEAHSQCNVLQLPAQVFTSLVGSYLPVKFELQHHARRFIMVMNELAHLSDLLTSDIVMEKASIYLSER